jgi:formyl transferase-like protein/beta-L-arabinofuranosidase (glycosyl hydrolase family 127)
VIRAVQRFRAAGWWKPSAAAFLLRSAGRRMDDSNASPVSTDHDALVGAAGWLGRAQDANRDGGISGRYRLSNGWSSSYPETTGYTVPTLLALTNELGDETYRDRASRCVDFLLSVQLEEGGFPALEIAENRTRPSPFNSAQIVHGLHQWHQATGDPRTLDAMVRAGRWICDVQDADGAWRAHFYRGLACTYSAHAACWLAELGAYTGERRFTESAERNLRWVLGHYDRETGWFDASGFSEADHQARRAYTHTIAYTLWGVWLMSRRLQVAEGIAAVERAAEGLMHRIERSRTLAGVLNHRWQPCSPFACLTGNAQLAVLWLQIAEAGGDVRFVNAAFKAIDEVKRAQSLDSRSDGIRGGVPGSQPAGGEYIPFALPNWAAKFFVDAMLAKRRCLSEWLPRRTEGRPVEQRQPADGNATDGGRAATSMVAYTTRISPTFAALGERWRARGVAPARVIIEAGRRPWMLSRAVSTIRRRTDDAAGMCRRFGWPYTPVATINTEAAVAAAARVGPDLAVNAGAGLLRRAILQVPRLGTLGMHMGWLPAYRGMNVAEWAALDHDDVGCSVFWIDEGVDTGEIVARRRVDVRGVRSIGELRGRADAVQIALLDEIAAAMLDGRPIPQSTRQRPEDGRQFYRMHPDVRRILDEDLARQAGAAHV